MYLLNVDVRADDIVGCSLERIVSVSLLDMVNVAVGAAGAGGCSSGTDCQESLCLGLFDVDSVSSVGAIGSTTRGLAGTLADVVEGGSVTVVSGDPAVVAGVAFT